MLKFFHKIFEFIEKTTVDIKRSMGVYAKPTHYVFRGYALASYSLPSSAYIYYYLKFLFFHLVLSFYIFSSHLFFFQQSFYISFFVLLSRGYMPANVLNFFLSELRYYENFIEKRYQNIVTPIIWFSVFLSVFFGLSFVYLFFLWVVTGVSGFLKFVGLVYAASPAKETYFLSLKDDLKEWAHPQKQKKGLEDFSKSLVESGARIQKRGKNYFYLFFVVVFLGWFFQEELLCCFEFCVKLIFGKL